jgi:dTMP kinase
MTGCFITFEGIDGSGKSTQLERCAEALTQAGYSVVVTRNPGGTELGQDIRKILLHHPGYVSPTCELMLYMADRAQHMDEVVFPALEAGRVVLCDRHFDSSMAYQGYGRDLSLEMIQELNDTATRGKLPDVTLLFDGPVEVLAARVSRRGEADRLEREALSFRQRVREGFLTLAKASPERIKVLDATNTPEALHTQVMTLLAPYLSSPPAPPNTPNLGVQQA